VEQRQLDIHEDQIGPLLCCFLDCLDPVFCLKHLIPGVGQEIAQDLPVVFLVLDYENSPAHARARSACCCSTLTGMLMLKVEPFPTSDSTQMRPPCISTMRREMDNPSPVPPFFLVAELSACWNSSKILARSASGIPGPVSHTDRV